MSEIEKDTRELFAKVATGVGGLFLWAMLNIIPGIFLGWAFFSNVPKMGNIVYYAFLVFSTVLLVRFLKSRLQKSE